MLTGLAVLCVLAACAAPTTTRAPGEESTTPATSEPRPPAEGETLVFSQDSVTEPVQNWQILGDALLPDGTIAVTYDIDYPQAGGDTDQPQEPRAAKLRDGSLEFLDLPVIADGVTAEMVYPVAASPAGDLLVLDDSGRRLLELSAATNEWSVRAEPPSSPLGGSPFGAYGPDGTLYVAVGGSVYVYASGEEPRLIAGIPVEEQDSNHELPLGEFPRSGMAQSLPFVRSMVVGDDGTVYLGFEHTLLALSDGQLTVFADEHTPSRDGGSNLIVVPSWREDGTFRGTFLTSLALDVDGAVLVSDSGMQRILRIAAGQAEVLIADASGLSNGARVGDSAQETLLFFRGGGDSLWAFQS